LQLLQEVSRHTGVRIRAPEALQEPVSVHFANLSLRAGLERLLASYNYILMEQPTPQGGRQPVLVLIAGRQDAPALATSSDEPDARTPEHQADAALPDTDANSRLARLQEVVPNEPQQARALWLDAANDPDPSIRQLGYERLYASGETAQLMTLLQQAVRSPESDWRQLALAAFGQLLPAEAVRVLQEATEDEHPDVRYTAFQQLSQQASQEAERALRARLTHANPALRLLAIEAMAAKGEAFAREAALAAQEDGDEEVRGKALGLLHALTPQEGGGQ
jgi:HEAT repeat protein